MRGLSCSLNECVFVCISRELEKSVKYFAAQKTDGFPGVEVSQDEVTDCSVPENNMLLKRNKYGQKQSILIQHGHEFRAVIVESIVHKISSKASLFNGKWFDFPAREGSPGFRALDENLDAGGLTTFSPEVVLRILPEGFRNYVRGPNCSFQAILAFNDEKETEGRSQRHLIGFPDLLPALIFLKTEQQVNTKIAAKTLYLDPE